ncbi:MAG: FtsQ-type POTRA domain-containing protein [Candidatus Gribaldobacteria bacterium]|nr:FtsQ-type POTRA domain-containing protein [Candidatus Gribaldobacteria bacterium]
MSQYRVKKKAGRLKAKYKKKESLWKNQIFRLVVWGIVLALALAYLLLFSPLLAINQVKIISPAALTDITPNIENLVNQKLENHLAFLSIKKTFFLLNTTTLKKEIETTMPQVEGVIIKKQFSHTITLQLKERVPRAVWCYTENDICYLIDKAGIAFQTTTEKNLPLIIAENKTAPTILPSQVIDPAKMTQILQAISFFQEKLAIAPQNCLTDGQDKLTIKTQEGWEAYFSLTSDIEPILTNLSLLIEKSLPQEKRKNLQYIDMRFSRVFYK